MSLVVWLPLTKDLRQQGLSNVTVTNNGATFNSAGKLGGCYYFNRSTPNYLKINNPITTAANGVSMAFWVKIPSNASGNNQIVHIGNGSGWNNNRCTCFIYQSSSSLVFSCGDGGGQGAANSTQYGCKSSALTLNSWTHVVCTYSTGKMKIYLNGVLDKDYTTTIVPSFANTSYIGVGAAPNAGEPATVYLNDIRIYDHCLSPMEVKELAKGLVLHYPLSNDFIQQMNNCYNYPRFENSASSAGWSHWGGTGHIGTYGQSTDSNYIFRQGQTYTHWVANGTGATYNYLLYQSPAFEGGTRSLQCICKEENGVQITNNICYATWNARSGGTENNSWTSIIPLGNGFYWCKCENIQQDGSNDLVGIYIRPGYKVYFSECYLENDTEICSNPFFQSNIVYDCSGFCNNLNNFANITYSSDTPKYSVSTFLSGSTYGSHNNFYSNDSYQNAMTVACWVKRTFSDATERCIANSWVKLYTYTDFKLRLAWTMSTGSADTANTWASGQILPLNEWTHVCFTMQDGIVKCYINGILKNTSDRTQYGTYIHGVRGNGFGGTSASAAQWIGGLSDFRFYATALSADDVKSLYQNSAYIDSSGNVYGAVHSEV